MTFTVHSIFKTIQGEGHWAGVSAVFCRFAGCNLWSGREEDRADAICKFCDTEFRHGSRFPMVILLAEAVEAKWGDSRRNRRVVFTGGEPGLQLTDGLIDAMHDKLFATHVETNGTMKLPENVRWVTLSPKANTELRQLECNELKVAWPQDIHLERLRERVGPTYSYLQPIEPTLAESLGGGWDSGRSRHADSRNRYEEIKRANIDACIEYVQTHPWWRVSIQTHKVMGMP